MNRNTLNSINLGSGSGNNKIWLVASEAVQCVVSAISRTYAVLSGGATTITVDVSSKLKVRTAFRAVEAIACSTASNVATLYHFYASEVIAVVATAFAHIKTRLLAAETMVASVSGLFQEATSLPASAERTMVQVNDDRVMYIQEGR